MKKTWRSVSLALVLTMMLTIGAVAAEKTETDKATVTAVEGIGATAYFSETNDEMITVTVTGASIKAGKEHLVLMVKGGQDDYEIKQETILYIDQKAASGDATSGSVTFDVYPSAITDSVIVIINESGSIVAAIVDGKYVMGDANGDGVFDVMDVTRLLRYLAEFKENAEIVEAAADVDGSAGVTVMDATKMLRVLAEFEEF